MNKKHLAEWLRRAAPHDMPPSQRRRALLRMASALAASAIVAPLASCVTQPSPRFGSYPFTLGVASGAPRPDSVVLWTRLLPDPLAAAPCRRTTSKSSGRSRATRIFAISRGTERCWRRRNSRTACALKLPGSTPRAGTGTASWRAMRSAQWVAHAPPPLRVRRTERLRFAFASCQQYEQGYYAAHRHMAREDLDLVVFLGDYIYESSWGRNFVRRHDAGEPYTLAEYRNRYALYKSDPDLQASHAAAPWLVTWDDHEVDNDYANDEAEDLDADFLVRRAAAYQAYYEHMPLAPRALPRGADALLYDSYAFGELATFFVLDDRQYRSHHACPKPGRGGSNVVADCAERLAADRTMLGAAQEAWLKDGLARTRARWNVIAQQTLMAQHDRTTGPGQSFWNDGWDGYPAARARLLDDIAQSKASNPLVIGGDVHCTWVADLKADFDDAAFAGRRHRVLRHLDHVAGSHREADRGNARAKTRIYATATASAVT